MEAIAVKPETRKGLLTTLETFVEKKLHHTIVHADPVKGLRRTYNGTTYFSSIDYIADEETLLWLQPAWHEPKAVNMYGASRDTLVIQTGSPDGVEEHYFTTYRPSLIPKVLKGMALAYVMYELFM